MLFASPLSLSLYLISRRLISGIQIIDVRFLCVQNYSDRFIIMVWSVLSFLFSFLSVVTTILLTFAFSSAENVSHETLPQFLVELL
jgi:hypothetical protein